MHNGDGGIGVDFDIEIGLLDLDVGRTAVVRPRGEIDIVVHEAFTAALTAACAACPRVVVDLTGASFIDASGLRAIAAARRMQGPDGEMIVRSPRPLFRRLFTITGLDRLVDLDDAPLSGELR